MVDQLLGGLFGGQDDEDDDRRRGRARDFVSRYEQGAPNEGYDDDEVIQNYRSVERNMSDDDFEEAATGAFGRMSSQDRGQMRDMMQKRAGGRVSVQSDDPRELARAASKYRREESGGGGLLSMRRRPDERGPRRRRRRRRRHAGQPDGKGGPGRRRRDGHEEDGRPLATQAHTSDGSRIDRRGAPDRVPRVRACGARSG
jgi:hypothetical protein